MLTVENLGFSYGKGHAVLKGLTVEFPAGGLVSVLGPNGSGKSTFLKCLGGILDRTEGDVMINGASTRRLDRRRIGRLVSYVPQEFTTPLQMRVFDFVLLGRVPYIGWAVTSKDRDIVNEILDFMDIGNLSGSFCQTLSGGQKQMVSIARSLAQCTPLILMDEPLSALDIRRSIDVMSKIKEISRKPGSLVLLVTHDINIAARYSDLVVILKNGGIYSSGRPEDVVTADMLKDVYEVEAKVFFDALGFRLVW
jgi:iron complex transport system ATP-binding protein